MVIFFIWKSITASVSGISKYKVELRWLLWNHENMTVTCGGGGGGGGGGEFELMSVNHSARSGGA